VTGGAEKTDTMRDFADLQHEAGLEKFLDSPLGSLFVISDTRGWPLHMVRHFDRDLRPELISHYVELVKETAEWIAGRPELARLVRVEQPTEIGRDFVTRPYYVYYTSTRSYESPGDPPDSPRQLEEMRRAVRAAIAAPSNKKNELVARVLARSLLDPTSKTSFDEREGRFIVVEPKLTADDVEEWAALSRSGAY
jgi:hypothetical protein